MNWTLDQLTAFVTAAKVGSFSGAARELGKAQSRVSTAISNLETDLGFELFDRSNHLPVLTAAGKEMLVEAKTILDQCDRLNARALSVFDDEEVSLVIASDEAVPIIAFQSMFNRIATKFPNLNLTVINGSRDDISNAVLERRADLGLVFRSNLLPDELEFHSIGQFRLSLIVAPNHPLATISKPTMSDLRSFRQLVICDRSGLDREEALTSNHWHIDSYYLISEMVLKGLGWALVPEHVVRSEWYRGCLVELSAENIPQSVIIEVGLVKRRDKPMKRVSTWISLQMEKIFDESSE